MDVLHGLGCDGRDRKTEVEEMLSKVKFLHSLWRHVGNVLGHDEL